MYAPFLNKLVIVSMNIYAIKSKSKERFRELIALDEGDVETQLQEECQVAEDWERNFKLSKAKGQQIGKIPGTEERIECFSVSFQPLRVELEILNRRYWELLVQTLSTSVIRDTNSLEKFATEAIEGGRSFNYDQLYHYKLFNYD